MLSILKYITYYKYIQVIHKIFSLNLLTNVPNIWYNRIEKAKWRLSKFTKIKGDKMAILCKKSEISKLYPELDVLMDKLELYLDTKAEIDIRCKQSPFNQVSNYLEVIVNGDIVDSTEANKLAKFIEGKFKDIGKEIYSVSIILRADDLLKIIAKGYSI